MKEKSYSFIFERFLIAPILFDLQETILIQKFYFGHFLHKKHEPQMQDSSDELQFKNLSQIRIAGQLHLVRIILVTTAFNNLVATFQVSKQKLLQCIGSGMSRISQWVQVIGK